MRRLGLMIVIACCLLGGIQPAQGLDYLEHSFFTDRACWQAQKSLLSLLEQDHAPKSAILSQQHAQLRARYLALALVCPERPAVFYCIDERKAVTSHINRMSNEPWTSASYPVTLGDYSALGGHLSRLGPVRGLGGARERGLTYDFFRWFSRGYGSVGGITQSVGGVSCWNTEDVNWARVEKDIETTLGPIFETAMLESVPPDLLNPLRRERAPVGPHDPAGLYSFSNPHYLDLVLRNHHHFGPHAYDTWLGYHTASIAIATSSCESTFALSPSEVKRIAKGVKGFENLRWKKLDKPALAKAGCAMLGELTRLRLLQWRTRADLRLSQPLQDFFEQLAKIGYTSDPEQSQVDALTEAQLRAELDTVVAALVGLVFEGSGVHFLQDGFAGGHVRTIRTRGGLAEAR